MHELWVGEAESWGNRGVASMSSTTTLIDKLRRDAREVQLLCLSGNTPLETYLPRIL